MDASYRFIAFERDGDVFCVHLANPRVEDHQMEELGAELTRLIDEENARKFVLSLGPEEPDCLISVFLAKMIGLQRRLDELGGALVLAQVSEHTRKVFRAAGIERFFHFYADAPSAAQSLRSSG